MAPSLIELPVEIIEHIAQYLVPQNPSQYLHEYKTSSIFAFRLASAQLAAKSHHIFAKTYFNSRIYHGLESKLNQLASVARDHSFRQYIKSISLILLPAPGAIGLDTPLITGALNGLPNLERLDLLSTWKNNIPHCSTLSADLYLPHLTHLKIANIALSTNSLVQFLDRQRGISSLDLSTVRIVSGSFEDILLSAMAMPNLRIFALARRYEGREGMRRWTFPFPESHDLYSAEDVGKQWAEEEREVEMRLGSSAVTIRAASREGMREGIEILLAKYRDGVARSKEWVRGQLVDLSSFNRGEELHYSGGICSVALIPN